MPNFHQLVFLSSATITFFSLYFTAQYFFPDTFTIRFGLLEYEYNLAKNGLAKMGLDANYFKINSWEDLLSTDRLLGLGIGLVVILIGAAASLLGGSGSQKKKGVLDPANFQEFPLKEKVVISPNTALYRFALPKPTDTLGVPIGQHITINAEINGKTVSRSYTPTSSDATKGHFDLVVKTYEQGNISKHLSTLKIGQRIKVKGPKGHFKYTTGMVREFGMIAGGTGITPMYQIITHCLYNSKDKTKINLIYANVNPEDILLKNELDELASTFKDQFSVYYVLNNPPANWDGGVGFVSRDMIQDRLPSTSDDIKILLCGPPPMITAMKKHLVDLKYPPANTISKAPDQVFAF